MERAVRLILEYDGSAFGGWQIQPNAETIQGALEKALTELTGEPLKVTGAGRTDAGVHALGQAAVFRDDGRLPITAYSRGLRSRLPSDIAVLAADEVPLDFHPIRDALEKTYLYRILNRETPSPLLRRRVWLVSQPLDEAAMAEAAARAVGRCDFSSFRASDATSRTTVRELFELSVRREGDQVLICARGDGFLKNMVRILAGTLVDAGLGKLDPDGFEDIIEACDRTRAGVTAPPQGLYLVSVKYR